MVPRWPRRPRSDDAGAPPTYILSLPAGSTWSRGCARCCPAGRVRRHPLEERAGLQRALPAGRSRPGLVEADPQGDRQSLPGIDVDPHFNPRYKPWDQRLCLVPDGDLFRRSSRRHEGRHRHRRALTPTGSGLPRASEFEADPVVTATGLTLLGFGGIPLHRRRRRRTPAAQMAYKALMLSEVPNFAYTIGYTNASWTLKADLVSEYVSGCSTCTTGLRRSSPCATVPGRDAVHRLRVRLRAAALDLLPKQGLARRGGCGRTPADVRTIRSAANRDGALQFRSGLSSRILALRSLGSYPWPG